MKATFLVPPCFDHKQPAERSAGCTRVVYPAPNIYELTVAAAVRNINGVEVAYRDCVLDKMSQDAFHDMIKKDNSDVYLIWAVNLSIDSDLTAISILRKYHNDTPIVLMGPGPTYFTDKCLIDDNIYIARGEPDATVCELIECLKRNAKPTNVVGLTFRLDGRKIVNATRPLIKDLDSLPFPARDLVASYQFHNPKLKTGPYTTMFTSRNCPFHCIYCVPSSLSFAREIEFKRENNGRKPTIGFRSVHSIESEVAQLASQGYKAVGFMDDNFIWDENRTRAICDIMMRYGIVWGCEARVDAITEPIARLLSEGNCKYVDLGVESFNDDILKYIRKGITVSDIYKAIDLLSKYKVPVKLNILIGSSPLETRETVLHTLREAKRLPVDQVMFNIVSPFPGTDYYKLCKANGWIKGGDYEPTDVQRNSILDLPNLTAREMEKLLFKNNLSFFVSPKFISRQIGRFSSWKEFTSAFKALKIKLFG